MARGKARRGVAVEGMLLLDKPDGLSSNHALQQAKRLLNARKAGHTGSLDPIATGLLPLCFGETTKVSGLFLDADKGYWVRIRLGVTTTTGDREGRVERESGVNFDRQQLHDALARFRGKFEQIPPMYSALKRNGQPLYKLARAGVTVERAPRAVTVYALAVEKWCGDTLELTLSCSRGFYVRTLASDLGDALGCGAHVSDLRRTTVGHFAIDDAVTLAQLEALDSPATRRKLLLPTDQALAHLPMVNLPDNIAFYLCRGRTVRTASAPENGAGGLLRDGVAAGGLARAGLVRAGLVRVYSDSAGFLGLAELTDDGKVTPKRLFHTP